MCVCVVEGGGKLGARGGRPRGVWGGEYARRLVRGGWGCSGGEGFCVDYEVVACFLICGCLLFCGLG